MTILILASIIGLAMAMAIGANDVANSMASAVGAKAITIKQAVIIAFLLEFTGAFFFGKMVTNTIRKGIVDPQLLTDYRIMIAGGFAALIAASFWVFIATVFSLPVSTTHAIVGGMTGFGIAALGWGSVNWLIIIFIVASWFLSPFLGGLLAFGIFKLISKTILHKDDPLSAAKKIGPSLISLTFFIVMLMFLKKGLHMDNLMFVLAISIITGIIAGFSGYFLLKGIKKKKDDNGYDAVEIGIFRNLQVITSCYVSLAHGSNDVANAIGPLAAIFVAATTQTVETTATIPKFILALGGFGIAIGVALWGHRVMKTVGEGITELTNTRGFSIDFATATTVFLASVLGLPVSSTHTVVGAVTGVGFARGIEALNISKLKEIALSWILTVPLAAVTAAYLFKFFKVMFIK